MTDDFDELRAEVENYSAIGRTYVNNVLLEELRRLLDAADEGERLRARAARLEKALRSIMGEMGSIEVLGEWEALDINFSLRKKTRARIDEKTADARAALADKETMKQMGSQK